MIAPQQLVEQVLARATVDETIVIVTDASEASLRWAGNSMTTNGVSTSRSWTVISIVRSGQDAKVGIVMELPIGNRAARGQVGVAEAARRQSATALSATQQRIAIEVKNAATALETAAGRIQAARAGLAAANTQLRAEQDRFGAGLSTNFFVLTRQNDLALAQLAEIAALTDYRQALTELGRATGTLLRDRGIEVQ